MKTLFFALLVFFAGCLSGWLIPFHATVEVSQHEPGTAVTFQGESKGTIPAADLLAEIPSGATRSRADYLARLEAANRSHDLQLQQALLSEWARHESAEGIRAVFEIGNRTEGWQLLRAWASFHPEEAVALAVERPNDPAEAGWFDSVHYAALRQLLLTEPEKAIAIENGFHRRGRDRSVPEFGLPGDPLPRPDAVLAALSKFRDPDLKSVLVEKMVRSDMLGFDSAVGIDWIAENLRAESQVWNSELAITRWIRKDFPGAGDYVLSKLDGSSRSRDLLRSFLTQTALQSTENLIPWLRKQNRESLAMAAPIPWFALNEEEHGPLAATLREEFPELAPQNLAQQDRYQHIPDSWPPKTSDEAHAWLDSFGSGAYVGQHLGPDTWTVETLNEAVALLSDGSTPPGLAQSRNLAVAWAKKDPVQAIAWTSSLPDELSVEVAETALSEWHRYDPPAAQGYVEKMPAGEFRCYAVELLANEQFRVEPEAAIRWVESLAPGLDQDAGRRQLASALLDGNPERALDLALAIGHPVMREEWVEESLRRLSASSRAAIALERLPGADLPPETEEGIRKNAQRNVERQSRANGHP